MPQSNVKSIGGDICFNWFGVVFIEPDGLVKVKGALVEVAVISARVWHVKMFYLSILRILLRSNRCNEGQRWMLKRTRSNLTEVCLHSLLFGKAASRPQWLHCLFRWLCPDQIAIALPLCSVVPGLFTLFSFMSREQNSPLAWVDERIDGTFSFFWDI